MGNRWWIPRGLAVVALLAALPALAGCSRPTPAPGQQTPVPFGQEEAYPGGEEDAQVTPGPRPGDPGYPPPNPLLPTIENPYPGRTATAEAAGAGGGEGEGESGEAGEATEEATAVATP